MSWDAEKWVIEEERQTKGTERNVLMTFAHLGNDDYRWRVWAHYDKIALWSNCSVDHARRMVRELEAKDLIKRISPGLGQGQHPEWRLNFGPALPITDEISPRIPRTKPPESPRNARTNGQADRGMRGPTAATPSSIQKDTTTTERGALSDGTLGAQDRQPGEVEVEVEELTYEDFVAKWPGATNLQGEKEAFQRALKRADSAAVFVDGFDRWLKHYRQPGFEKRYIKYLRNWLDESQWLYDPPPARIDPEKAKAAAAKDKLEDPQPPWPGHIPEWDAGGVRLTPEDQARSVANATRLWDAWMDRHPDVKASREATNARQRKDEAERAVAEARLGRSETHDEIMQRLGLEP